MPFVNGGHVWLILALVVVLVIFGPGKLPELGAAIGKTIKAFKRSTEDLKSEISLHDTNRSPAVDRETITTNPANPAESEG